MLNAKYYLQGGAVVGADGPCVEAVVLLQLVVGLTPGLCNPLLHVSPALSLPRFLSPFHLNEGH